MSKQVIVDAKYLEHVEQARIDLYKLMDELKVTDDINNIARLTYITQPIWLISNKRWPEYKGD